MRPSIHQLAAAMDSTRTPVGPEVSPSVESRVGRESPSGPAQRFCHDLGVGGRVFGRSRGMHSRLLPHGGRSRGRRLDPNLCVQRNGSLAKSGVEFVKFGTLLVKSSQTLFAVFHFSPE